MIPKKPRRARTKTAIMTVKGEYFDCFDYSPEDIDIEAIAHSLGNQARFNGHTTRVVSVAEHSLRVAEICLALARWRDLSPEIGRLLYFLGLMHDAEEGLLGDIVRPLKTPEQRVVGEGIQESIMRKMGRPIPPPPAIEAIVKEADEIALAFEAYHWQPGAEDWINTLSWKSVPEMEKDLKIWGARLKFPVRGVRRRLRARFGNWGKVWLSQVQDGTRIRF